MALQETVETHQREKRMVEENIDMKEFIAKLESIAVVRNL